MKCNHNQTFYIKQPKLKAVVERCPECGIALSYTGIVDEDQEETIPDKDWQDD